MQSKQCFHKTLIPHFKPEQRWLLASQDIQDNLSTLENNCSVQDGLFDQRIVCIGDVCDIGNGMVSGLDNAFKVDDISLFSIEEKHFLIHVLKAKDLAKYFCRSSSNYVFLPPGLSEETLQKQYPNIYQHFQEFKTLLFKRYSYNRELPYWEFAFPCNQHLFEQDCPKIFIPCKERISKKKFFRFCYAPKGYYPLQDVTGVLRKPTCRDCLEYILAYLNTDFVFNWICYKGIMKGDIAEFSEAPIANIPFRSINWDNPEEVSLHETISRECSILLNDHSQKHISTINLAFQKLVRA